MRKRQKLGDNSRIADEAGGLTPDNVQKAAKEISERAGQRPAVVETTAS